MARLGIVRLGDLARYQDVVHAREPPPTRPRGGARPCRGGSGVDDPSVGRLVIVAEDGWPAIGLYQRAGFAEVARHVGVSRAPA